MEYTEREILRSLNEQDRGPGPSSRVSPLNAPSDDPSSWQPVDLGPVLRGEQFEQPPTMWRRSDGVCLLYAGKVHAINAESESGKTWMALHVCAELMSDGEQVVFIDFEDSASTIVGRLVDLGVPKNVVEMCFHYIRPDEPLSDEARAGLVELVTTTTAGIAVVDGVTEAMVQNGWSINDNDDTAKFFARLVRPIQLAGAAVLLLDHVTKSKDGRGRHAIGAQHKLSGVDGAVYLAEGTRPYGRGLNGASSLTVMKDRPGHVRPSCRDGKAVGTFRLTSLGEGKVRPELVPVGTVPPGSVAEVKEEHLVRLSQALANNGGWMSQTKLEGAATGNSFGLRLAATWLVASGFAELRERGQAKEYRHVKPYQGLDE